MISSDSKSVHFFSFLSLLICYFSNWRNTVTRSKVLTGSWSLWFCNFFLYIHVSFVSILLSTLFSSLFSCLSVTSFLLHFLEKESLWCKFSLIFVSTYWQYLSSFYFCIWWGWYGKCDTLGVPVPAYLSTCSSVCLSVCRPICVSAYPWIPIFNWFGYELVLHVYGKKGVINVNFGKKNGVSNTVKFQPLALKLATS